MTDPNAGAIPRTNEDVAFHRGTIPFLVIHALGLMAPLTGLHWKWVVLCIASYYLRIFAITAGFHRYFAHRSYKTGRVFQFMLAFLGETSSQKGVLWWAGHHRHHHQYSDQPEDLHSPLQRGFWWSHVGWFLCRRYNATPFDRIRDFAKYPELVWLNKHWAVPPAAYGAAMFLLGGWPGLFWGFFLSTVIGWHGTFTINSLAHVFGRRIYRTADTSRNSMTLALLTMGEGWHNNHHYYAASVRQGFHWWQLDFSYYALWLLKKVGLIWDMKLPTPRIVRSGLIKVPSKVDEMVGEVFDTMEGMKESLGEAVEGIKGKVSEITGDLRQWPETARALANEAVERVDPATTTKLPTR